jgi:RNA polymerase sigma-70 factor (ECF subfamily)
MAEPELGPEAGADEAGLVRAARSGSREAFEELVRRHQSRVFALLRRSVPPDEVEDLAQEAFLRAFRRIDRFRGEARFGTWLNQIVVHLTIDRARQRHRRPPHVGLREVSGEPGDAVPADPAPDPAEASARRGRAGRLEQAIAELSEADRIALLLHDQDGMTADEVGKILAISAGALRVRLFRIRRRLRERLSLEDA